MEREAAAGDTVAKAVLRENAKLLIGQAAVAAKRLGMENGELALIGGLAESDTVYRECLLREAAECMPGFTCVSPRQTAAVGAVMMGRAQL